MSTTARDGHRGGSPAHSMVQVSLLGAALDLVLPRSCAGCGRPGAVLCGACVPHGLPVAVSGLDLPVFAAGSYDGGLRAALVGYKERGRRDAAPALGGLLAGAVGALNTRAVLVPVPSTPAAARARGGDHVVRLAHHAARRLQVPVSRALRLDRLVADSAGLTRPERAANLAGAMAVRRLPGRLPAIVVDDIVTSGATLREAVRALHTAGWMIVGAATVAATPRHTPPGSSRRGGLPWA